MARIIDVIEAPDQGAQELVVRVPEVGSGDFRFGSQVIVRESQRAVFYRDGKSLDLFEPGRHTITTANLPILSGLLRMGTGGQDIFTAEVFFANMREFTDMKWGTPEPITLRDTDLGLVRLRGFGQYTMQIADPKRFVDQFVGTQGMYRTGQINDFLRSAIISRMTDMWGENMTSILDLPRLFDELSAAMRATLQDDFTAMGLALKTVPHRLDQPHRGDGQGDRRTGQHGRHRRYGRLYAVQDGARIGRRGPTAGRRRRDRRRPRSRRGDRPRRRYGRHDHQRHERLTGRCTARRRRAKPARDAPAAHATPAARGPDRHDIGTGRRLPAGLAGRHPGPH